MLRSGAAETMQVWMLQQPSNQRISTCAKSVVPVTRYVIALKSKVMSYAAKVDSQLLIGCMLHLSEQQDVTATRMWVTLVPGHDSQVEVG